MRKWMLAALTLLISGGLSAAELTEKIDRTFDVRPGATVVLANVNGGVTVTAWDQPRVRVIAYKKVEADSDDVKDALRELRVDLQPRDGGLVITTRFPKNDGASSIFDWLINGNDVEAEVRYELTVPRSMSLDVENVNGAIRVSNVAGKHELETTNGRIELTRCAGSLEASTTNGRINAELTSVTKGQPLRLSTTNGRIEVALPSTLSVDIDAGTTNGAIHSDLPVATTRSDDNSLRGSINGGGTQLRLRTTNGGISIKALK
ncbi:MAG TPA: DUF4097 family beta strand repeat-containing protein [Thermoanaerobaculia bacterium]